MSGDYLLGLPAQLGRSFTFAAEPKPTDKTFQPRSRTVFLIRGALRYTFMGDIAAAVEGGSFGLGKGGKELILLGGG